MRTPAKPGRTKAAGTAARPEMVPAEPGGLVHRRRSLPLAAQAAGAVPANVRTNDNTTETATQSEVSLAAIGSEALVSWNDGSAHSAANDVQGYTTSSNGGPSFADGGGSWSSPKRVTAGPVGSEDFLPESAAGQNGYPCVAWFDQRDDPAQFAKACVYAAHSIDGGGARVRTLSDGDFAAGEHSIVWDGRDGDGARLPAGAYFARLQHAGRVATQRLVLLHQQGPRPARRAARGGTAGPAW